MILRDKLALQRTQLANQRTLLAFIGTTLHFIILALTFSKIEAFAGLEWLAIPFYVVAGLILIIGIFNFKSNRKVILKAYDSDDLSE
jgi:putative membrane protein